MLTESIDTRAMYPEEVLREIFTYHAPTPDQLPKYQAIRDAGLAFALVVHANTPAGPDRTTAIRCIRESVMTANAAVALNGQSYR
jgi:hypothetical protein